MSLAVAIQMDPIDRISIAGDSSFALMLEAQRRGHSLFYYEPKTLAACEGTVFASGHAIDVRDKAGDHFTFTSTERRDLARQAVILLRQDPPFDMNYITITHLLERLEPHTLVVNNPGSVRNAPEKLHVMDYPGLMPETLITRDPAEAAAFRRAHGDIIIKPLYGNGGAGVFRLTREDQNFASLMEMFTQMSREPFIVQRYLPDVRKGDKRIILVDGVFAGAINRVPAAGETRSNMHVGGKPEATELTTRERDICEAIGPRLRELGLIFVGIDVIGDYLTEINVTSPTGIREVKRFGGADIAALIWDAIERRL